MSRLLLWPYCSDGWMCRKLCFGTFWISVLGDTTINCIQALLVLIIHVNFVNTQVRFLTRIGGETIKETIKLCMNRLFANMSYMSLDGRSHQKTTLRHQPICKVIVGMLFQCGIYHVHVHMFCKMHRSCHSRWCWVICNFVQYNLLSVLRCCWLGGRKGIWPVKTWVMRCWCGYLSVQIEVQMTCIWSGWFHCHPTISFPDKKASICWQDSARRQFQAGLRGDVGL